MCCPGGICAASSVCCPGGICAASSVCCPGGICASPAPATTQSQPPRQHRAVTRSPAPRAEGTSAVWPESQLLVRFWFLSRRRVRASTRVRASSSFLTSARPSVFTSGPCRMTLARPVSCTLRAQPCLGPEAGSLGGIGEAAPYPPLTRPACPTQTNRCCTRGPQAPPGLARAHVRAQGEPAGACARMGSEGQIGINGSP